MSHTLLNSIDEAIILIKNSDSGGDLPRWIPLSADEIKSMRRDLNLTQAQFALRFGFDLGNLRNWEQGRRTPGGDAMVLLNYVKYAPEETTTLNNLVKDRIREKSLESA